MDDGAVQLPRGVIWFADCLTLVPGQVSCLLIRHDRKSGDWVPEGAACMLFVVQGVASIQKAVLFIKAVCSTQPSLVALMDRLGRSDPSLPPRPEKNNGRDYLQVNSADFKIPLDSNWHNL